jgi:hypothetical protein
MERQYRYHSWQRNTTPSSVFHRPKQGHEDKNGKFFPIREKTFAANLFSFEALTKKDAPRQDLGKGFADYLYAAVALSRYFSQFCNVLVQKI